MATATATIAQAKVAECRQKLEKAEKEVRESTAGSLLNEYLAERRSEDYRAGLALLG